MKARRKTFQEYLVPFEKRAKGANCKLSNKNKARIKELFVDYCLATYGYGFGTLFYAVYEGSIATLLCDFNPFLSVSSNKEYK